MTKQTILLLLTIVYSNMLFSQTGEKQYEQANKFFEENKPKKALEAIDKAIAIDGEQLKYLAIKSNIGMYVNPDISFDAIQRMLKLYPDSVKPYERRAIFYFEVLRDYEKCVDDLNHVLTMTKDDSITFPVYNLRGTCYSHMGKVELALIDIEKTISIKPLDYDLLNNKALCLHNLNRTNEAIDLLKTVAEKKPTSPYPYVNLGYLTQKLEQYEASVGYLTKAVEIDPKVAFTWNNLGYSQYKTLKYKDAIKSIEKSLKIDPNNPYAYRNLALIAIEQKEMDKACKHIKEALILKFTEMYGSEVADLNKKYCLN